MATPGQGAELGRDGEVRERRSGCWAAAALLRELARRFAGGWRAAPRTAPRRWLAWMAAGFVLAGVLMEVLVRLVQHLLASGALAWERPFEAHAIAASPISISSAIWFQTIGTDVTLWILVALTGGIAVWARRPFRALAILFAYVVMDLVVRVGWATWHRLRPDLVLGGAITPGFASFPSGHTAKTLAVYGILAWFWARASRSWLERILAFVIVAVLDVLTAYGRMRMGAHWPTDLLGGVALGLFWLLWTILVLQLCGVDKATQGD